MDKIRSLVNGKVTIELDDGSDETYNLRSGIYFDVDLVKWSVDSIDENDCEVLSDEFVDIFMSRGTIYCVHVENFEFGKVKII